LRSLAFVISVRTLQVRLDLLGEARHLLRVLLRDDETKSPTDDRHLDHEVVEVAVASVSSQRTLARVPLS
jgi:hypothetical protein